ncbi:MAG: DNA polymerase III subunit [Thermodesulfobacteriota bacterium]
MAFSDILSHDREISILKRAVKSGRVAHAYLFAGIDGIGKRLTAKELGRALNCEEPLDSRDGDSCGRCASCTSFETSANLNYMEVAPEGGYLKIDKIRDLQRSARHKMDTSTRVIVVEGADAMQKQAANAFLKTLEEPTPGTVIVLLTSRPSVLLPTIISRCQRINFSPLPSETVASLIMDSETDTEVTLTKEEAELIASLSMGSMAVAKNVLRSGVYKGDSKGGLSKLASGLFKDAPDTLLTLKSAGEMAKDDDLYLALDFLKLRIRDMVVAGEGAPEFAFASTEGIRPVGFEELDRIFEAVERAKRDMMPPRNANKQLTLEVMLMELDEIRAATMKAAIQ